MAGIKDREGYDRPESASQSNVLGPIIANIKSANFTTLKDAISTQVINYIKATTQLIKEQSFISSLFSSHGTNGLVRAFKLKSFIHRLADGDTAGLLDLIKGLDGGNYNQGSLRTFIAKAFYDVGTRQNAVPVPPTRFSDEYDDGVGIIISGSEHSHHGAKADFGVVDFLEQVITSLKEFLVSANVNNAPR